MAIDDVLAYNYMWGVFFRAMLSLREDTRLPMELCVYQLTVLFHCSRLATKTSESRAFFPSICIGSIKPKIMLAGLLKFASISLRISRETGTTSHVVRVRKTDTNRWEEREKGTETRKKNIRSDRKGKRERQRAIKRRNRRAAEGEKRKQ